MKSKEHSQAITFMGPTSAGTTVHSESFKGAWLTRAEGVTVDAALAGGTGGTLDIYLQRKLADDEWVDWIHFAQLAAGATKKYTVSITGNGSSLVEVGGGSNASPGVALAANTAVDVTPAGEVRIVLVAGVGTSAGASNKIRLTSFTERFG